MKKRTRRTLLTFISASLICISGFIGFWAYKYYGNILPEFADEPFLLWTFTSNRVKV